jgi:hypothetical protein
VALNPDTHICILPTLSTMTNSWLRDNLYRDAAPSTSNQFLHRDSFLVDREFVPRSRLPGTNLYLDGKNRAVVRSLGLRKILLKTCNSAYGTPVVSQTFTNAHRRAVMFKPIPARPKTNQGKFRMFEIMFPYNETFCIFAT